MAQSTATLERLRLRADRLRYRPEQGAVLLEGHVRVSSRTIQVSAGSVRLSVDPRTGRPLHLRARGSVRLRLSGSEGRADALELGLSGKERRLVLSGRPHLRWAPLGLELSGRRVEVDLRSGRLNVQQAEVELRRRQPGAGDGGAAAATSRNDTQKGGTPDGAGAPLSAPRRAR